MSAGINKGVGTMKIWRDILISHSAIVTAPFDKVYECLLESPPTGRVTKEELPFSMKGIAEPYGSVMVQGGPVKYSVFVGQEHLRTRLVYVEVDRSHNTLAFYGGWWYRNEYIISRHEQGALIRNNIVNIAPGLSRLLLPFSKEFRAQFGEKALYDSRHACSIFLENVAQQLACSKYFV